MRSIYWADAHKYLKCGSDTFKSLMKCKDVGIRVGVLTSVNNHMVFGVYNEKFKISTQAR